MATKKRKVINPLDALGAVIIEDPSEAPKGKKAAAKAPKAAAKAPKAAAKTAAAEAPKLDETRQIKAVPGQEGHFYKGFPRMLAYQLLLAAPKRTMPIVKFLDEVVKLPGVKSRNQARGIAQKLVTKPGDDGVCNGQIAHYV
jgi:hypothetical protein